MPPASDDDDNGKGKEKGTPLVCVIGASGFHQGTENNLKANVAFRTPLMRLWKRNGLEMTEKYFEGVVLQFSGAGWLQRGRTEDCESHDVERHEAQQAVQAGGRKG